MMIDADRRFANNTKSPISFASEASSSSAILVRLLTELCADVTPWSHPQRHLDREGSTVRRAVPRRAFQ